MNNFGKLSVGISLAIAVIVGSAFRSGDTYQYRYYGVADNASGTQFHWQAAEPNTEEFSCGDVATGACVISTPLSAPPAANAMPSGTYAIESGSNRLYKEL